MSMNDDDDEGRTTRRENPDLDCMIEASLADDLGVNSAVFEWIIWIFRPRHRRRANDSPMGLSQNIRAIQMARQKNEPEVRMPELSSNG